jgi:hypothetical protein
MTTLTASQVRQLLRLAQAPVGSWHAARDHGERVTLASLHGRGLAERQPRARHGRQQVLAASQVADNAWAYRITPAGRDALTRWAA